MPQKPQNKIARATMSKLTVKRLFSDSDSEDEIIEVAADGTMTPKKHKNKKTKKIDDAKFLFRKDYFGNNEVLKWTLKEYAREHAKYPHLTEFIGLLPDDAKIIPFIDFDMTWDNEDDLPSAEEEEEIFDKVTGVFRGLFKNENVKILSATRSNGHYCPKKEGSGCWKVSLRLFAPELVTTRKMLATMLKGYTPAMDDSFPDTLRNYDFEGSFFDTSVYDKNRKMCCVGKTKWREDERILERREPIVEETKYLIQNVSKDAQEVQWAIEKPTPKTKKMVSKEEESNGDTDIVDDDLATVHRCLVQFPKFEETYAKREIGTPKLYQNAITVFMNTRYCILAEDEHDTSVSKMYFVLTRDAIKFKCAHCDSESKVQNEDQQLVDMIERNSTDVLDKTKPLSLKTAAQIYNNGMNERGLIEYLNMFFAKVTGMDSVIYASRETPSSPWLLRKKSQFFDAIEHLSFKYYLKQEEGPDVEEWYKLSYWASHVDMRTFPVIKFIPSPPGDVEGRYINLFRGFKAKRVPKVDMERVQPILDHCLNIVSNHDHVFYDYMINWMAHIVQFPHIKTGTAPVISGAHGSGKNTLFDFFGNEIIGEDHFISTSDIDQLTGRFNSHQALAIFILANEVTFAGAHKSNQKLKSMITEPSGLLEKKGVDSIMLANFNNFVFLSNLLNAVRVENGCRRYAVNESSSERKGDYKYFRSLRKLMYEPGTGDHFYTYLMDRDLSDFNVFEVPMTQTKADMATFTKSPYDLFVDALLSGEIVKTPARREYQPGDPYENGVAIDLEPEYFIPGETYDFTMRHLFELYIEYNNTMVKGSREGVLNKESFAISIRKHINITDKDKTRNNRRGGTPIIMTVEKNERV